MRSGSRLSSSFPGFSEPSLTCTQDTVPAQCCHCWNGLGFDFFSCQAPARETSKRAPAWRSCLVVFFLHHSAGLCWFLLTRPGPFILTCIPVTWAPRAGSGMPGPWAPLSQAPLYILQDKGGIKTSVQPVGSCSQLAGLNHQYLRWL